MPKFNERVHKKISGRAQTKYSGLDKKWLEAEIEEQSHDKSDPSCYHRRKKPRRSVPLTKE